MQVPTHRQGRGGGVGGGLFRCWRLGLADHPHHARLVRCMCGNRQGRGGGVGYAPLPCPLTTDFTWELG